MKQIFFDFYGVPVAVSAEAGFTVILEWLELDFGYFKVPKILHEQIRVHLMGKTRKELKKGLFIPRNQVWVRGWGMTRTCDYGEGHFTESSYAQDLRKFCVFGENVDRVYEMTYMALLSSVGEALDLRGFHRVHGLGFQYRDLKILMPCPSGGGKSAVAAILTKHKEFKFFSDEIPLVKKSQIYPFPIRMALHPSVATSLNMDSANCRTLKRLHYPKKILFPFSKNQIASSGKVNFVLIGRPGAPEASIEPVSPTLALLELAKSLVVGFGLPQMAEHMIRTDNLKDLVKISLSRARELINLMGHTTVFSFNLSKNANENAQVLKSFISKRAKGPPVGRAVPKQSDLANADVLSPKLP